MVSLLEDWPGSWPKESYSSNPTYPSSVHLFINVTATVAIITPFSLRVVLVSLGTTLKVVIDTSQIDSFNQAAMRMAYYGSGSSLGFSSLVGPYSV